MGQQRTPVDAVSISKSGIILGRKVSWFFEKRYAQFVNIVLDYNNDSLIIIDSGKSGYRINYQRVYTTSRLDYTMIKSNLLRFIGTEYNRVYQAKPLNEKAIIIRGVKFLDNNFFVNVRGIVRMKERLIILGCPSGQYQLTPQDFSPRGSKQVENINQPRVATNIPPPKHIVDKEIGNNKVLNSPSVNQPTPEEIEQADKEYSKMILGE